jgi:hypothetical protein
MRRPSLLRATTSDSEGPSQRQIWLFRLAKFLLVLTFVEDGLRMIIHPEGQARVALGLPSVGPSRAAGEAREDYLPAVKAAAFVGGILQTWLAVFRLCGNQISGAPTRCCLRSCVCSMAWSFQAIEATLSP